jgi:transcriptional regulator with XRE-family HTH domain
MTALEIRKALGLAIRKRREDQGYSQEEIAHNADLHRTYFGAIERGERNVSLNNLLRISAALQCRLSTLIREAEGGR